MGKARDNRNAIDKARQERVSETDSRLVNNNHQLLGFSQVPVSGKGKSWRTFCAAVKNRVRNCQLVISTKRLTS